MKVYVFTIDSSTSILLIYDNNEQDARALLNTQVKHPKRWTLQEVQDI